MSAIEVLTNQPDTLNFTAGAVSKAVFSAGSGAIGTFIYKLAMSDEAISSLGVDLLQEASGALAINVLLGTMPHVAFAVAWVVGIKSIVDLQRNKFIKTSMKARLMGNIVARSGASLGLTIGSAMIGQALIPIPLLGSFIGGVIGGFSAAALFSSYDKLIAKRVSLELLFCSLLLRFADRPLYSDSPLDAACMSRHESVIAGFVSAVSPFLAVPMSVEWLRNEMTKKDRDTREIVDDLYASSATRRKDD